MPDIDLTPANEQVAAVLFAHETVEQGIRDLNVPGDLRPQFRLEQRQRCQQAWLAGQITDSDTLLRFRELALAATLAVYPDVARQAFNQGVRAQRSFGSSVGSPLNPYREEAPDA